MVYRGRVENGAIRLKDAPALPDGAAVEVRLLAEAFWLPFVQKQLAAIAVLPEGWDSNRRIEP